MINVDESRIIVPQVTVVVHPVNCDVHPLCPPGFRWAVMVGGVGPTELKFCVNAGHDRAAGMAAIIGESHGVAVVKGLHIMGIRVKYTVLHLDYDPIPAEADNLPLVK